jgi:hypothetical protein
MTNDAQKLFLDTSFFESLGVVLPLIHAFRWRGHAQAKIDAHLFELGPYHYYMR